MRLSRAASTFLPLAILFACAAPGDGSGRSGPAAELHALFDREWQFRLDEDPLMGEPAEGAPALRQMRPEDLARREAKTREFLDELRRIDRDDLALQDRINYAVFERQLSDRVAGFEFDHHMIPITVDLGFHIAFARLPKESRLDSLEDYELYIARLNAFPEYVRQHIELMRSGLSTGMTLPQVVLDGYEVTIESHVVEDPEESVFWAPFADFPLGVPSHERDHLARQGRDAILNGAVAGYREFLRFMVAEYIPGARETTGAFELPRGREYYDWLIRHFTTLDLTAEEIHEIGLGEVARIRAEMMEIIDQVGFEGDFAAFLEFLRTDPQFYAKTPDELLQAASFICKRMDARLPRLFKTMPRTPYGVAPVPAHLAPKYTGGRYVGPAEGSTEPGWYWVNTYALESRPLYVLTALSLHEAVPGHHLQGALAAEQAEHPSFRRYSYLSAYGEGWGLYSEWLGLEVGMYEDPYQNFGRLTYEMWRACRLVVDTGIHAMGWSRQRAMDYLSSNTALSLHECRTETDRYISWPGQALSYKLGELKIKELRRRAEQRCGQRFDLREFHDVLLLNGSVPLDVLEELVDEWLEKVTEPAG